MFFTFPIAKCLQAVHFWLLVMSHPLEASCHMSDSPLVCQGHSLETFPLSGWENLDSLTALSVAHWVSLEIHYPHLASTPSCIIQVCFMRSLSSPPLRPPPLPVPTSQRVGWPLPRPPGLSGWWEAARDSGLEPCLGGKSLSKEDAESMLWLDSVHTSSPLTSFSPAP